MNDNNEKETQVLTQEVPVQTPNVPNNENVQTLSDNKKLNKRLKFIFIIIIVATVAWVGFISPQKTFKTNEKSFTEAAEKYFNMYTNELPTGKRVAEVSLQTLYSRGFLREDFYLPYNIFSKKTCSVTKSWVKVVKENNDYKYYTYLDCGIMKSNVDHKGPEITLNGKETIELSVGEKYKEPGVKTVKDNKDGNLNTKDVVITGEVNTDKIGEYEISYTAGDSLNNKTTVKRKVNVVQKLNSTIKKATNNTGYYTGTNPNNYIYFSGMLFRIVDIDKENVRIIADRDVSNVNYDGLDKWLDYYYEHIADSSKELVVKNKYCQMTIDKNNINTTECNNYTKEKNVYIVSVADVNKAETPEGNYLRPLSMSWTADKENETNAYLTRNMFYNDEVNSKFVPYEVSNNYGVRPILTIKGDTLLKSGNGTKENPYNLNDFKKGKADDKVNTRNSGEYLQINGELWRIVEPQEDGTTKVILESTLHEGLTYLTVRYSTPSETIYSLDNNDNVGYKINNQSSEYIKTNFFVNHEIEVPIYKKEAKYGKETKSNKIKAKIAAPNMYEMFSAASFANDSKSYWYINSSQDANYKYGVSDTGSSLTESSTPYLTLGVRPVAYITKNAIIVSGQGTEANPYKIDK